MVSPDAQVQNSTRVVRLTAIPAVRSAASSASEPAAIETIAACSMPLPRSV